MYRYSNGQLSLAAVSYTHLVEGVENTLKLLWQYTTQ